MLAPREMKLGKTRGWGPVEETRHSSFMGLPYGRYRGEEDTAGVCYGVMVIGGNEEAAGT